MRWPALRLLAITAVLALPACSNLLVYYPSSKYDNKIVRGVVTHIATKEEMAENWDRKAAGTEGVPSRDDFIQHYKRVTVTIEKGIGSGEFIYPFVPEFLRIDLGDLVDVPGYLGGRNFGKFSGRLQISEIICKAEDLDCFSSPKGRLRGDVGSVPIRY